MDISLLIVLPLLQFICISNIFYFVSYWLQAFFAYLTFHGHYSILFQNVCLEDHKSRHYNSAIETDFAAYGWGRTFLFLFVLVVFIGFFSPTFLISGKSTFVFKSNSIMHTQFIKCIKYFSSKNFRTFNKKCIFLVNEGKK